MSVVSNPIIHEVQKKYEELGECPGRRDLDKEIQNKIRSEYNSFNEAIRDAGLVPNTNRNQKDVIRAIKQINKTFEGRPKSKHIRETNHMSVSTLYNHFDTFKDAVEAADLDYSQTVHSDEELLNELHKIKEEKGDTPTISDIDECNYSYSSYISRFGGLNNALEEAGIEVKNPTSVSDEDIIEDVRRVKDELGHNPQRKEYEEYGNFSSCTVLRKSDNWEELCNVADIEPPTPQHLHHTEELIDVLRELGEELERRPHKRDVNQNTQYWDSTYIDRFGSWNEAIQEAGFEPWSITDNKHSDDDLIQSIKDLHEKLGYVPNSRDMDREGPHSHMTYLERFNSWKNALEAAGFEAKRTKTSIEKEGANILEDIGYEFEEFVRIGPYEADAKVGDVVIEWDGVYWHGKTQNCLTN